MSSSVEAMPVDAYRGGETDRGGAVSSSVEAVPVDAYRDGETDPGGAVSSPAGAAGGPVYLDVGAVRIQTYLARTRRLWGRRGASAILAAQCEPGRVARLCAELSQRFGTVVQPNPQAPAVDGVISVTVADPDRVYPAAEAIAAQLSDVLPGVQLAARAAPGATYLEAYAEARRREPVLQWLPAQLEYPPTRLCQECGQDAAVSTVRVVDDHLDVCPDCYARRTWQENGWPQRHGPTRYPAVVRPLDPSRVGTFTVEARLKDELGADTAVGDFGQLAGLARHGHGNHLATIAADGNSMGRFFARARAVLADRAARGQDAEREVRLLRTLSGEVAAATREALTLATAEVYEPAEERRLPVIPHILGGDDVLVSVTADQAWAFVRRLLAAFDGTRESAGAAATRLAAAAGELGLEPPTLSAGVVISHASLPFGQQVALSAALLEQAKAAVDGNGYSVAWLDATADGTQPVAGRRPLTAAQLSQWAAGLDALAALPGSTQEALRREIATGDAVLAQQRLKARLRRHEPEVAAAVGAFLDGAGQNLLSRWNAAECVRVMQAGLSLARWWR